MKKILICLCLFYLPLFAEHAKIFVDNDNNLAMEGYDVVTYFSKANPEIGIKTYETSWQDAKWRFASAENLSKFEANPEKYAPQFGGYCAWALVDGRLVGGLTNIWKITDGKLYLFCSHDALQKWIEGGSVAMKSAHDHWTKLSQKND